jgi:DNA-binding transcriptional LysR family regulator
MRSLNLDQLRALAKVVELGSFSAAARQLNLTQPAVSLQIRELERRFGVQLIERSASGRTPRRRAAISSRRRSASSASASSPTRRCVDIGTVGSAACISAPPTRR